MGIPGCGIVSGVSTADNRGLSVLGSRGEATALARHDNGGLSEGEAKLGKLYENIALSFRFASSAWRRNDKICA